MTTTVTGLEAAELGLGAARLREAWVDVMGTAGERVEVELIHRKKKSRVYRLRSDDHPDGVIAKHCLERAANLERLLYEVVLPATGLRHPMYHGWTVDPGVDGRTRSHWVFLEDLGSRRHSPTDAGERRALGTWLGTLARASASLAPEVLDLLPARGPAYYTELLDQAVVGYERLALDRAFAPATTDVLARTSATLAIVARRWPEAEDLATGWPPLVVHGDCVPKNVHVTVSGDVVPLDWGSVGTGLPGADLGTATVTFGHRWGVGPDVDAYVDAARDAIPALTGPRAARLALVGRLLYVVKVLAQSLPAFEHASRAKVGDLLGQYLEACEDTVHGLGWAPGR